MFSISYATITAAQRRLMEATKWCVGACFAIHSVKSRTLPVVFVAEGSFDKLYDPGCP